MNRSLNQDRKEPTIRQISNREKEVLNLIAWEYSTKEIAEILYISTHTALTHRKRLLAKFGVRNTAGLIRRAFETKILKIVESQEIQAA